MTPNTGYWMPGYAYFDFLEERGWNVEELRECEDWCYPFGFCVDNAFDSCHIRRMSGSHNISEYGSSYSGGRCLGWYKNTGHGDLRYYGCGDGNAWARYD